MRRNLKFDIIRAIAIIFVIGIHSLGLVNDALADGDTIARYTNAAMGVVYSGVPLFVMLSGALLLGKEEAIGVFFKKRMSRVLIPFLFWSVIVGTILYLQSGGSSVMELLTLLTSKIVTNGVHGIYWYVYMIIGLYLITPLLRTIIHHSDRQTLFYMAIFLLSIVLVGNNWKDFDLLSRWGCANAEMLFFFVSGYLIVNNLQQYHYFKQCARWSFCIFLMIDMVKKICCLDVPFMSTFLNMSLFCTLLTLPDGVKKNSKFLSVFGGKISEMSYGIYLSHFMLISAILKLDVFQKLPLYVEPIAMMICVLLVDMVILYVLMKIGMKKFVM